MKFLNKKMSVENTKMYVEDIIIFTTKNRFNSLSDKDTIYKNCVFYINEDDINGKLNYFVNNGNL